MEPFVFLVFFLSCVALFLSIFRGRRFKKIRALRFTLVAGALIFYVMYFVQGSVEKFSENLMQVKLINKLPQPLDFHVIRVKRGVQGKPDEFIQKHSGKIRPEHFRVEYLNMEKSTEFWIAGYLGKKEMVYFSQHSVADAKAPRNVEVHNYINQSQKLSARAAKMIEEKKLDHISSSVYISLGLLLLFINLLLLFRRR